MKKVQKNEKIQKIKNLKKNKKSLRVLFLTTDKRIATNKTTTNKIRSKWKIHRRKVMNRELLVEEVKNYLEKNEWKYEWLEEKQVIRTGVKGLGKLQSLVIGIKFDDFGYNVFAISPIGVEEKARMAVMEYITRVNCGLIAGNFELNMDEGDVRYKTYVNASGLEHMPEEIIGRSIYIPCRMFHRYEEGLVNLMFGYSDDVKGEVARCEQA